VVSPPGSLDRNNPTVSLADDVSSSIHAVLTMCRTEFENLKMRGMEGASQILLLPWPAAASSLQEKKKHSSRRSFVAMTTCRWARTRSANSISRPESPYSNFPSAHSFQSVRQSVRDVAQRGRSVTLAFRRLVVATGIGVISGVGIGTGLRPGYSVQENSTLELGHGVGIFGIIHVGLLGYHREFTRRPNEQLGTIYTPGFQGYGNVDGVGGIPQCENFRITNDGFRDHVSRDHGTT
jgi:hypothetical protein